MVDARVAHTDAVLHAAILRLAAEQPLSRITVAEVARAAGINRATFYAHGTSPGALLAQALIPELDTIRAQDTSARRSTDANPGAITEKTIDSIVEHVVAHREIYRRSLSDSGDASLHSMLADHLTDSCLQHIEMIGPDSRPDLLDDVAARYVAYGIVGAIEAWLAGRRRPRHDLVETIIRSLPDWWS